MSTVNNSGSPLLLMRTIMKDFPGVRALDGVTFEVRAGEVHALVGENGAGKSTLMKILSGALPSDSGGISLDGHAVQISSPHRAQELGISMIYQDFNLVPYLSVGENILLGREPLKHGFIVDWRALRAQSQAVLDRLHVSLDVAAPVRALSVAQRQMVEIARAISARAKILIMDEPSSTLTDHELRRLFELVRSLRDAGAGVIYISHRLEEVFEIADRITVLRDGKSIGTHDLADVDRDEVIRMMVGREITEKIPKQPAPIGEEVLRVEGLCGSGVRDIGFSLRAGEILGLTGLVGAGRTEVARLVFGADAADSGAIYLSGKPVVIRSPRDAISLGMGFVTEDRQGQGLVLAMNVRENVTLANMDLLAVYGFVRKQAERNSAKQAIGSLRIRTPSAEQLVRNLSGGNQQKVVLARWVLTESKVLIFDEPTRGIDVGAKVEIYQLMNELAARGVGILMISSELPEVLGMSDRVLVMHAGRIVAEFSRNEATQERIMFHATGGA
jgi:ribose transport system ATP-binding protein